MNPYSPGQIKEYAQEKGIYLTKKRGQNFLVDRNTAMKIVELADVEAEDTILEIGPGLGALTFLLAKKAARVIAVEIDNKLEEALRGQAGTFPNLEIIKADILELEHKKIVPNRYKLISSLPYNITSPVIFKFLKEKPKPVEMVIMVQKEVAERMLAKSPHMNILALVVSFYGEAEILKNVSKNNFYPRPEVDSAVVKIKIKKYLPEIDEKTFWSFVKSGFSAKRKKLANNLANIPKISRDEVEVALKDMGLDSKSRAENLSLENWINLSKKLNH